MCGIVGVAGVSDEKLVRRMAGTIIHRGPDGEGYFVGDGVSLGVRRLAIIDLPGSNQPIWNENRTIVTVFNGEIYNYKELRHFLEKKGHVLRTAGDTEVLVHLYEEYGEAGVHLLRGMFAYAIWDVQRRRLVLTRDRLGIKPLYYTESGGRLIFGSEIKSILAIPGVPREADHGALGVYLTLQYVPGPRTMLRGIYKLPPGHLLVWQDGQTAVRQYWDVVMVEGDRKATEETAAEEFQALLQETVDIHRISDVPIGVLLSGGIDSSTVVAELTQIGERPTTFTVGFQTGEGINEIEEARLVARHFDTDHHEIVTGPSIAEAIPRIVWYMDEPVADPAAVPTYFICQLASESVKVLLSGEGGDELLGGYPRYRWLDFGEGLRRISPGWLLATARGALGLLTSEGRLLSRLSTLLGSAPLEDRHLEWVGNMDEPLKSRLLTTTQGDGQGSNGAAPLVRELMARIGMEDAIPGLMYVDFKTWLPDNILTKTDRMSMAVSVEARVPLLDHRVVEFVAGLPQQVKIRNFGTKRLLRQAMKGILPARTLQRPKQAFQVPLRTWFAGPLRELLWDTLTASRAMQRGSFRSSVVAELLAEQAKGRRDRSRALWTLFWLELWTRQFVDAAPAAHH